MANASWIDATVVLVYLAASFVIGLVAARILRSGTQTEEGYFLAGRKMPGWLAGSSFSVTAMNADVAPLYAGVAVGVGVPIAWFYMSRFAVAFLIGAILFAFLWRRLAVFTAPQFFSLRFGGNRGNFVRVFVSIYGILLGMVPWIGAGLLGTHMILGPIFGIESRAVTLAIVLPLLLIYVWISGYAGVLVTDFLQSVLIVVANMVLGVLVLVHYGGPLGLTEAISAALPEKSAEVLSATPVSGHSILSPLIVFLWFIIPTLGYGGNMATEGQRLLSCRNEREAMKSMVWSTVVLFLMLFSLTIPVLGLLPMHPELYMGTGAEREQAYGMLLAAFLPVGFLGLALAALVASVMSTIDSHLNYGAQLMSNDVLGVLRPDSTQRFRLIAGRISMIVILLCAIAVVYYSESLIQIAVFILGFIGVSITLAWGQWWWWRVNFISWITAMAGGPIVYLTLLYTLPHAEWWKGMAEALGPTGAEIMGLFRGAIGMGITTVLWVSATLLTRPESDETLDAFYLKARPFGLWGPVRRRIEERTGEKIPRTPMIAPGLAIALLGSAWISALFVGLSVLYVGRYTLGVTLLVLALAGGLFFRRAFSWYYERLEERFPEREVETS